MCFVSSACISVILYCSFTFFHVPQAMWISEANTGRTLSHFSGITSRALRQRTLNLDRCA
jgi:hypothetical protein